MIFKKKYGKEDPRFAVREREIWRYAGYKTGMEHVDEELKEILKQVMSETKDIFSYQVCYRYLPLTWEEDMPKLPIGAQSKKLADCLRGSSQVVIFAATIGLETDRYIAKYQRLSPTKALLMQAYGAERAEVLCDVFCDEIAEEAKEKNLFVTPRFSPGYGDLPLAVQKDVFELLDCTRQIGISLNEQLLMVPSKSVTAFLGLKNGQ